MPRFFACPNCMKNKKHVPLVTDGDSRICSVCGTNFPIKSQVSTF